MLPTASRVDLVGILRATCRSTASADQLKYSMDGRSCALGFDERRRHTFGESLGFAMLGRKESECVSSVCTGLITKLTAFSSTHADIGFLGVLAQSILARHLALYSEAGASANPFESRLGTALFGLSLHGALGSKVYNVRIPAAAEASLRRNSAAALSVKLTSDGYMKLFRRRSARAWFAAAWS